MKVFVFLFSFTLTTAVYALPFDSNVPEVVRNQMLTDLDFIKSLQGNGASPLHQKIYGQMDGSAYAHFFSSRVLAVGLSDCNSLNAIACIDQNTNPTKLWITPHYVKFSHPQMARLMVVFHEARHTEKQNGFWLHARCPNPFKEADGTDMKSIMNGAFLQGQKNCDITPFGSYGSSALMLKNIAKLCTNCSSKVKMDSDIYSDDQLKRIVDAAAQKTMREDLEKISK